MSIEKDKQKKHTTPPGSANQFGVCFSIHIRPRWGRRILIHSKAIKHLTTPGSYNHFRLLALCTPPKAGVIVYVLGKMVFKCKLDT